MQAYIEHIKGLQNPEFQTIRRIADESISHLSQYVRDLLWRQLNHGVTLLDSHELMCQYLWSYGNMHQAKLLDALKQLPSSLYTQPFEIIDWGCGQAMGTINLFDYLKTKKLEHNIKKITLVEPSQQALDRGILHTSVYASKDVKVISINKYFENVTPEEIESDSGFPQLHIFSNILDVAQIDLKHLATLINQVVLSDNYLVCVGPLNPTNQRIDAFLRYFNPESVEEIYAFEDSNYVAGFMRRPATYKARIYKLEPNTEGHLIPIEYYPTVQFHAAYELDILNTFRKKHKKNLNDKFTHFEVAAPFDLGASVYDDVHPILAVAHNIISRGLPTKASVFVEEKVAEAFNLSHREVTLGEIKYVANDGVKIDNIEELALSYLDDSGGIRAEDIVKLQLLLTPIAVARFQKVLVEAIITGKLPLEKEEWLIMVEENDVPFAALAIKDFESLFNNLTQLSEDFMDTILPRIKLNIVSNTTFNGSPLHLDASTRNSISNDWLNTHYDLVVTQSVLKSVNESIESFSKFKCRNNCYFNIRTIDKKRKDRVIYTSNRIRYKNIIERDTKGNYLEIAKTKIHLSYFLQLLFRKESFRPGQLPILDRALRNLPVIGLLPTGGGKSLTYQIAALLQPGVTLIIDPLKSLMKDQYDGLINNGVDCAAFINSSLSPQERKEKENQIEASQLIFVFLSPERLSIASFRERLKNMHDYNVYFSYGVIDEVHCVSEWGHDFRFSYLHLGRNLYNYVRAKENEISLFGLTATASFDVLADVERELSGNGAFNLDADVIVRYENTNRLELQYKIEKIKVEFAEDQYYDKNHIIAPHLPRAVNITDTRPPFFSKSAFLQDYTKQIPRYINELQQNQNIQLIKNEFVERQNNYEGIEQDLKIEMPYDYYSEREVFNQAGIVFCPHVNSTGLSVNENSEKLKQNGIHKVGSFSGADNDDSSMKNLENFRDNKIPLMVATKAFGMGIDKPNVRFTINMNYSSSLESFVQEAGRAGRDRRMALSTILLSDYSLAKINGSYQVQKFPLGIIKNKWFLKEDLESILEHYDLSVPDDQMMFATPSNDIVKLHCSKDNKAFAFGECEIKCSQYKRCSLAKVNSESKGWKAENELIQELRSQGINLSKKNFQYLNPDYNTVMYFFNESFKGDFIEKIYMVKLLNTIEVEVQTNDFPVELETKNGFLETLKNKKPGEHVTVFIPYVKDEDVKNADTHDTSINRASDLSKAIYRMTCIELIEDFTQDYTSKRFRIIAVRKSSGDYYRGLRRFLLRYYTEDRAKVELEKAKINPINYSGGDILEEEIYKCLAYLTEFVYDKISEKRKRAIDDMRNFCIEGLNGHSSWIDANERLKDYIYYYFNSKYAKTDYIAENGEPFSLVEDTEGGKKSDSSTLFKYLRVIDDDIVGVGTPLDNVKHLYGAVRLISRSLTDSNPALALLEAFCLIYLGTRGNKNLENQLIQSYSDGLVESSERASTQSEFWNLFESYNKKLAPYLLSQDLLQLKEDAMLRIHTSNLKNILAKYTA
ncbi:MAG TPA: recombinase RecQ [Ignavibacteriales bacterium]|nr:recombinase RecQ [Ignavibacteriales bacterium]